MAPRRASKRQRTISAVQPVPTAFSELLGPDVRIGVRCKVGPESREAIFEGRLSLISTPEDAQPWALVEYATGEESSFPLYRVVDVSPASPGGRRVIVDDAGAALVDEDWLVGRVGVQNSDLCLRRGPWFCLGSQGWWAMDFIDEMTCPSRFFTIRMEGRTYVRATIVARTEACCPRTWVAVRDRTRRIRTYGLENIHTARGSGDWIVIDEPAMFPVVEGVDQYEP